MRRKQLLTLTIGLWLLGEFCPAQLSPASPPLADPADTRFRGVTEDRTSPGLGGSHLTPVLPLVGYVDDHSTYTVELVRVQWRWGDPIDLYVMKPKGIRRPPVILYLYGYPADTERFKSETFQKTVTRNGFAAVGFVSALTGQRYHDRPIKEWFVSELQEVLAVTAHDVQMILNYLTARGDLDMKRVGLFAQGSGASIAVLASAVDPRIKVVDALDPWGDWPDWMALSGFIPEEERAAFLMPEFLRKTAMLEPTEWLPKTQARKFRLQDATFDSITPRICKEKIRAALPARAEVVIYKNPEEFDEMVRRNKGLDWIQHQLLTLEKPAAY